jgi:hypothetical protein
VQKDRDMLLSNPLPFVEDFINELNQGLKIYQPEMGLSRIQRGWLGFCLMGIILTNSLCWARFERASLGKYQVGALSWMFRHAKLPWELMLQVAVSIILRHYGIQEGVLVTDDSDHRRSKKTKGIYRIHKIKDKSSGGYINGQTIVLLMLVTPKVSLPVGFEFYQADPALQVWKKEDKRLQKQGLAKKNRPPAPEPNPSYPSKPQLALQLMEQFHRYHSQIKVKYPGEKDYRYLVATDLSWRTLDIIQAYSLRWLVEVFFEDWKSYEGWAQLAKQTGEEGSSRGLTLSLLLDLCLLLHPEQLARVENKLPAYTVGSLQRRIQIEALLSFVQELVQVPNPMEQLTQLSKAAQEFFSLRSSGKHMIGRNLGRLEPTPTLKHRAIA